MDQLKTKRITKYLYPKAIIYSKVDNKKSEEIKNEYMEHKGDTLPLNTVTYQKFSKISVYFLFSEIKFISEILQFATEFMTSKL
jgi:hypothetical protein